MKGKVQPIKRVIHMHGLKVVLLAWGAATEHRLRNVVGLRTDGSTQWLAELPDDSGRDCFVGLEQLGMALVATTFSGARLHLCPATGTTIGRLAGVATTR